MELPDSVIALRWESTSVSSTVSPQLQRTVRISSSIGLGFSVCDAFSKARCVSVIISVCNGVGSGNALINSIRNGPGFAPLSSFREKARQISPIAFCCSAVIVVTRKRCNLGEASLNRAAPNFPDYSHNIRAIIHAVPARILSGAFGCRKYYRSFWLRASDYRQSHFWWGDPFQP